MHAHYIQNKQSSNSTYRKAKLFWRRWATAERHSCCEGNSSKSRSQTASDTPPVPDGLPLSQYSITNCNSGEMRNKWTFRINQILRLHCTTLHMSFLRHIFGKQKKGKGKKRLTFLVNVARVSWSPNVFKRPLPTRVLQLPNTHTR